MNMLLIYLLTYGENPFGEFSEGKNTGDAARWR